MFRTETACGHLRAPSRDSGAPMELLHPRTRKGSPTNARWALSLGRQAGVCEDSPAVGDVAAGGIAAVSVRVRHGR